MCTRRYHIISKYKTIFMSLRLRYELTLAAANLYSDQEYKAVQHIMADYMRTILSGSGKTPVGSLPNSFYDQGEVISRSDQPVMGIDISMRQITWFAVKVLHLGNVKQKRVFRENYGCNDPESIEAVYKIYEEMRLDELLLEYEESSFHWLQNKIRRVDNGLPHEILSDYVENLYKRKP